MSSPTFAERLIVVDGSIHGDGGHHLEYARHVLTAARHAGLRPLLAANSAFSLSEGIAEVVYPVLERDYWGSTSRRAAPGAARSRFLPRCPGVLRPLLDRRRARMHAEAFRSGLTRLHEAVALRAADVLLLPSVSVPELWGLAQHVEATPAGPTWHVVLRRDPPADRELTVVPRLARRGVHFHTDTAALSSAYRAICGVDFGVLPIPVAPSLRPIDRSFSEPLHVVFIGDARREKGYQHLPDLLAALWSSQVETGRLRFTVQSSRAFGSLSDEPEVARALNQLRRFPPEHVRILDRPLSSADYHRLLLSSDILLLPYQASEYRLRSSGIFAEALRAGVPTLVPAETWMGRQLSLSAALEGAGVVFDRPERLAHHLQALVERYPRHRAAAVRAAETWACLHNPEHLAQALLSAAPQRTCQETSVCVQ